MANCHLVTIWSVINKVNHFVQRYYNYLSKCWKAWELEKVISKAFSWLTSAFVNNVHYRTPTLVYLCFVVGWHLLQQEDSKKYTLSHCDVASSMVIRICKQTVSSPKANFREEYEEESIYLAFTLIIFCLNEVLGFHTSPPPCVVSRHG